MSMPADDVLIPPASDSPEARAGASSTGASSTGASSTGPGPSDEPAREGLDEAAQALAAERDEYVTMLRQLQADFENYRKRALRQQAEVADRAAESLVVKLLPVLDTLELARTHLSSEEAASTPGTALLQASALLTDILTKEGLEPLAVPGEPFDPEAHDAVEHLPAEQKAELTAEAEAEPAGSAPAGEAELPSSGQSQPGSAIQEAGVAGDHTGGAGSSRTGAGGGSVPEVAEVLRSGYRWKGRVVRPAMVRVRG